MLEELKTLIEESLGNCTSSSEVCEVYAEIQSHTKEQMKFVLGCMESNKETLEPKERPKPPLPQYSVW